MKGSVSFEVLQVELGLFLRDEEGNLGDDVGVKVLLDQLGQDTVAVVVLDVHVCLVVFQQMAGHSQVVFAVGDG